MYGIDSVMPDTYIYKNKYNATIDPSTVHVRSNALSWFFKRYLIQKVFSVFEFSGVPETWAFDYFRYSLFVTGKVAIIHTDKFGTICQHCALTGQDVFYRPTHAIITNPLIKGDVRPRIGTECALIRMQPDYAGCWDLVEYYADQLALCAEALGVNLVNSKLAYVFAVENKTAAESMKKLFDDVAGGDPAVFVDKKLFGADGQPMWDSFSQNLQQNYIADKILIDMAKIDNRFDTEVGITNVNITKTSGVSNNEIAANNNATRSKAVVWLETIQSGLEKANNMFRLNMSVDSRFKDEEVTQDDQKSLVVD